MTEPSVTDFSKVINTPFLFPKLKGFTIPLSISEQVWDKYIDWTDEDSSTQCTVQNIRERFQGLLYALQVTLARNPDSDRVVFEIFTVPRDGESKTREWIPLEAVTERDEDKLPLLAIRLAETA